MADDVKLQLGIDVEALQRSATQATSILTKAFEQQNLGANVLGSGVPASQLPSQAGSKDTLRGVIDALERVDRTLTAGFMSLGGVGFSSGGGAGGGAGGGTRGPDGRFLPQGGGGGASPGGWASSPIVKAFSQTGEMIAGPLNNAIDSGGYSGDVMKTVSAGINSPIGKALLGPLGPGASIAAKYVEDQMQKKEDFRSLQYEMWKSTGSQGMKGFTDAWTTDDYFQGGPENTYGMSMQKSLDMRRSAARSGGDVNATMQLEGTMGQGDLTAGLSGALKRSGNKGDIEEMAQIIGTALNVGLDQSRFPDAMAAVQRAAESSTATNLNLQRELSIMSFIGAGGPQYAPGSAKYDAMRGSLEKMGTDMKSPDAFLNAWEQSGHKWDTARSMMEHGVGAAGGVDIGPLVERYWSTPAVQAWAKTITAANPEGDRDLLASAAGSLQRRGVPGDYPALEQMLKDRSKQLVNQGATAGQVQVGREMITAPPPQDASAKARADTRKQQKGILGGVGYVEDTSGPTGSPRGRASAIDSARGIGFTSAPTLPGMEGAPDAQGIGYTAAPSLPGMTDVPSPSTQSSSQSAESMYPIASDIDSIRTYDYKTGKAQPATPHGGEDIVRPPGSPVNTPIAGKIVGPWFPVPGGSDQFGFGIQLLGDDGVLYRFLHLAKTNRNIVDGRRYPIGTFLGNTRKYVGGSAGHLHLEAWRSGKYHTGAPSRAYESLGAKGVATMFGPSAPDASDTSASAVSDSAGGDSQPAEGVTSPSQTAGGVVTHKVEVHITHDNSGRPQARVKGPGPTVTQAPGQMIGSKK